MWSSCKTHSSLRDCIQTNKQRRQTPQGRAEPKTRGTTYGHLSSIEQAPRGRSEPETRRTTYGDSSSRRQAPQGIAEPKTTSDGSSSIRRAQRHIAEPVMRGASSGNSLPVRPLKAEASHREKESMFSDELSQCYSMSKFSAATRNFSYSHILYDGVYKIYGGPYLSSSKAPSYIIYRGMCTPDGISKLKEISHLSHPNLASMVGYCSSDVETIVGYKNEGYQILLHQLSYYNLSWLKRLNICIGAAEALRCIHTAKIVHGGISPITILLDNSYCAKLVTFGSVLIQWFVFNGGRQEFLPLDIAGLTKPTEKTDVYLFGLVLLILFCGKKTDYSNGYPFLLPVNVCEAIKRRTLHHITDLNLTDVAERCLNEFLRVVFCCLSREQVHRPSMDIVLEGLKRARDLQTLSYFGQIQGQRHVSI